jgi:molybdenum cofactor cytidylyltransferase
MNRINVAAVILAAGASRRLGRPKQLLEYQGETLVARAVRIAGEAGLNPAIVVLGAHREAVLAALANMSAISVDNSEWQEGIASSMRAGLKALEERSPDAAGVLIMPCDQPRLNSEHLLRLLSSFAVETISASTYAGVRGVPAVFPRSAFPELMNLSGDTGARKLLVNPPCPVIEVPFEGGDVDIDTPEDITHLQ